MTMRPPRTFVGFFVQKGTGQGETPAGRGAVERRGEGESRALREIS